MRGGIRLDDLTAPRMCFVHSIAEHMSFEEVRFLDNRSGQYDYPEHKASR